MSSWHAVGRRQNTPPQKRPKTHRPPQVLKPGVEDVLAADMSAVYLASRLLEWAQPELSRLSLTGNSHLCLRTAFVLLSYCLPSLLAW